LAGLDTATSVAIATQTSSNASWLGANVSAALAAAGQKSRTYLRVSMAMTPSTDGSGTPSLLNWRQTYNCIENQ